MPLFSDTERIESAFAQHVRRFGKLYEFHSLRSGSPEDFLQLAPKLATSEGFRLDFSDLVRTVRDAERGAMSAGEMLTVAGLAIGGPGIAKAEMDLYESAGTVRVLLAGVGGWSDGGGSPKDLRRREQAVELEVDEAGAADGVDSVDVGVDMGDAGGAPSRGGRGARAGDGGESSPEMKDSLARLEMASLQLKVYLDDIDRRMGRIEPHLEDLTAMVQSSTDRFPRREPEELGQGADGAATMPLKEAPAADPFARPERPARRRRSDEAIAAAMAMSASERAGTEAVEPGPRREEAGGAAAGGFEGGAERRAGRRTSFDESFDQFQGEESAQGQRRGRPIGWEARRQGDFERADAVGERPQDGFSLRAAAAGEVTEAALRGREVEDAGVAQGLTRPEEVTAVPVGDSAGPVLDQAKQPGGAAQGGVRRASIWQTRRVPVSEAAVSEAVVRQEVSVDLPAPLPAVEEPSLPEVAVGTLPVEDVGASALPDAATAAGLAPATAAVPAAAPAVPVLDEPVARLAEAGRAGAEIKTAAEVKMEAVERTVSAPMPEEIGEANGNVGGEPKSLKSAAAAIDGLKAAGERGLRPKQGKGKVTEKKDPVTRSAVPVAAAARKPNIWTRTEAPKGDAGLHVSSLSGKKEPLSLHPAAEERYPEVSAGVLAGRERTWMWRGGAVLVVVAAVAAAGVYRPWQTGSRTAAASESTADGSTGAMAPAAVGTGAAGLEAGRDVGAGQRGGAQPVTVAKGAGQRDGLVRDQGAGLGPAVGPAPGFGVGSRKLSAAGGGVAPPQSQGLAGGVPLTGVPVTAPVYTAQVNGGAPTARPTDRVEGARAADVARAPRVENLHPDDSNGGLTSGTASGGDQAGLVARVSAPAPVGSAAAAGGAAGGAEPGGGDVPRSTVGRPPAGPATIGGMLLEAPPAVYPQQARQMSVQGKVVIRATIDKNGYVSKVEMVDGPLLLQGSARDAVKRRRYTPLVVAGAPREFQAMVTVDYKLGK